VPFGNKELSKIALVTFQRIGGMKFWYLKMNDARVFRSANFHQELPHLSVGFHYHQLSTAATQRLVYSKVIPTSSSSTLPSSTSIQQFQ
jgi:hypothetical protein